MRGSIQYRSRGGDRGGRWGGGELSPVPKLLASVAFNIPTTQSINIDTSREQERQRSTHIERQKESKEG